MNPSTTLLETHNILNAITSTECSICLSALTHTNFTSTECGHWFHSSCIFQNMLQRVECPLCRAELADIPEDESSDNDEEEETYDEEEDESIDNGEDEDTEEDTLVPRTVTCNQLAHKITSMGYTMADLAYLLVGRLDPSEKTRYTRAFREKLEHDVEDILSGDIPVDYRDSRTYAEVLAGKSQVDEPGAGPKIVDIPNDSKDQIDDSDYDDLSYIVKCSSCLTQ